MSKKIFDSAIQLALKGDEDAAIVALKPIDHQFVKKRFITMVSRGVLTKEQAIQLWLRTFPDQQPFVISDSNFHKSGNKIHATNEAITTIAFATSTPSEKIDLSEPVEFLSWLSSLVATRDDKMINLGSFNMIQPWGLVALATLARLDGNESLSIYRVRPGKTKAEKFAIALGVWDVIDGREPTGKAEVGRTVKMRRINDFSKIEFVASEISHLIVKNAEDSTYIDSEEVRRVIYYVLVELMRNVLQHSHDPLGGVVVAQSMNAGGIYEEHPSIQVAVADNGIGIYQALKAMHSEIINPGMALERSLWPHYSGVFDETKRGSGQNAGLGLFFISEMAKLSGGRLLIASRGDALSLVGDETGHGTIGLLNAEYPGTLVVFEIPKRGIADYDELNRQIISRAEERTTKRHDRKVLRYDVPPKSTFEILVNIAAEDTVKAEELSKNHFIPILTRKEPIVINFINIDLCTQSFIHALLYDALRVAWAMQVPIYVKQASEPVKDSLRLVQMYALSDVD